MQYSASSTICGTPGARKSARPYLEICTGTSRINGPHWQTNPYSVRRNGSLPSCRKIIRSSLLSVRLRFMTAELSEKSRMMKTFMYVKYAVPRKWSVLHGSMPIQMNISAIRMTVNGVLTVKYITHSLHRKSLRNKCNPGGTRASSR